MKALGWVAVSVVGTVALHCSVNPQPDVPLTGAPGSSSTGNGAIDTDQPGATTGGGGAPTLPPEVEVEEDFRVPVSTGRFVWTANPESNRVALVDATSFAVATLDAGFAPTYLAALPSRDDGLNGAVVLNALSSDANVFLARDTSNVLTSDAIRVHEGANAWSISESGRWAIAWTNARQLKSPNPTEGFQDVSIIDLDDYPDTDPVVTRVSVGYRPTRIVIASDESRAFAVTEPGISVIELTGQGGPRVSKDIGIAEQPAADVAITPDGRLALARETDSQRLVLIDLDTGERRFVELSGVVTDLDLSHDGSFAVAVVRGIFKGEDEPSGGGGQAGQSGWAGGGGEGDPASGGAGPTEPGFGDSTVVILPVPDIFDALDDFSSIALDELVGSVVVPAAGDNVLLYTNAIDSDRVTILNGATRDYRTVELKAPVRALFATQDGRHALGLLAPPPGSTKAGAFSLIPVARELPPKLEGTLAPGFGVAVSNGSAVVTTLDATGSVFEAYIAQFPSLRVDPVELPSAPTASGILLDANVAYVAQEHPEGRITFVDLDDASARTLTGFELGVKVIDGE